MSNILIVGANRGKNANPLVSRGFYSLFRGAKCEPSGEQRILLLVLLPILNTFADQITHLCGTDLCHGVSFIFFLRHDINRAITVF